MIRFLVHYGIHFLVPVAIAYIFYRKNALKVSIVLLATFIIDVDHLFATPIFNPNRCSINYHLLHSFWAIGVYVFLLFPKKTRLFGVGLLIHIIADSADCLLLRFNL